MLIVILFTFLLMRQIKGNPFRKSERALPASIEANMKRKFGLDKPWYVQYWQYTKGVFTFDLGPSLASRNQSVNEIIKSHFPVSLSSSPSSSASRWG
jgi:ABC-type dipeptide/oligopeptide/nickel transport system permease component